MATQWEVLQRRPQGSGFDVPVAQAMMRDRLTVSSRDTVADAMDHVTELRGLWVMLFAAGGG